MLYVPNLAAALALALAASSSRFLGGAVVSSERSSRFEMAVISLIAASNASSFTLEGLLKPVILRTNWSDAARVSSSVTGGSKLNRVLMFLHITQLCEHLLIAVKRDISKPFSIIRRFLHGSLFLLQLFQNQRPNL